MLRNFLPQTASDARRLALFVVAIAFLNLLFNLRFPAPELALWYVLPSLDVMMILGAFLLLGLQGWRVPKAVHVGLVALAVLVRVLRLGDGVQDRYYAQRFTLYDLALLPEGVRFAHSTLPAWKFWPLMLGIVALLILVPIGAYRAFRTAEAYLADFRRAPLVGVLALVAFGVGLVQPRKLHHRPLFTGGFGKSAFPRIRREVLFIVNVMRDRDKWLTAIERAERDLARIPRNLEKLGRRDVHLVLIESYGEVALARPDFAAALSPTFAAIESSLAERGFSIASGRLASTTFGGRSWLAHATLATTIPVTDQLGFDMVLAQKPKTLASYFRDAGYRAVLAAPGVTRPGKQGDLYRFDKTYYYKDFDYAGPRFGWATMPDQFVFELVRRRELGHSTKPLFIQYVLVSSHAPWNETPTIVEDWSRLKNGAIFDTQPVLRFPVVWPDFDDAHEAYIRSIVYDFEVIKRYVERFLDGGELVIVMGDHPPVVEITGDERARSVPVHVLSRSRELIEPFLARGFVPGMWTRGSKEPRGMETFLTDFLRDFSKAR